MKFESNIEIEELFNYLLENGHEIVSPKPGYEMIDLKDENIEILTYGSRYVPLLWLSRHKTEKYLFEISIKSDKKDIDVVTVTSDHICMVYDKDHFFENKTVEYLHLGDYVSVYDENSKTELVGTIIFISILGQTEDWVYDCEVKDEMHSFYANNVLVHNSQFSNIEHITDFFKMKFNLPDRLMDWPDDYKLKLWKFVEKFVEEKVNPFVQNLVKEHCFTEHPEVLRYSLEYIADSGIYEQKKRYCVHKMVEEGPILVDKFKYTGIELKKATTSVEIKNFLRDIYENTCVNDWTSENYKKYLDDAYEKFCKMKIDEIAFWKKWSSDKIESEGFLKFGKGTTGLSKACKTYNQMLSQLKIGKKYDSINLGDQIRYCYVYPSNQFGIEIIAFPNGSWPKEFDRYFQVDYPKMFEKTVLDPLKSFRIATNFINYVPTSKPCDDVFSL